MLTLFKVKCILIGFEVRIRMISKTLVVVIDIVLGVNFQHIYGICFYFYFFTCYIAAQWKLQQVVL